MTIDPIMAFRADLRAAAVRKANAYKRRRRSAVVIAVALGAVLIVGGAIAAQSRWFNASSQIEVRSTAAGRAAALDYPARGYAKCMADHGLHRVNIQGGGWDFQRNAAAASACKPYLEAFTATCRLPRRPGERVTVALAAACAAATRYSDRARLRSSP